MAKASTIRNARYSEDFLFFFFSSSLFTEKLVTFKMGCSSFAQIANYCWWISGELHNDAQSLEALPHPPTASTSLPPIPPHAEFFFMYIYIYIFLSVLSGEVCVGLLAHMRDQNCVNDSRTVSWRWWWFQHERPNKKNAERGGIRFGWQRMGKWTFVVSFLAKLILLASYSQSWH